MKKYLYRIWIVLMGLCLGIALWFSAVALKGVWHYFKLNGVTTATSVEWKVKELSLSKYALEAEYEYAVQGKICRGKTVLKSPRFLNPFAAEHEKKDWSNKSWKVWYAKSNPMMCSLEKRFPQKQVLQALLTLGVLAYFYFARRLVSERIIEL